MNKEIIILKPATMNDADILFKWRNDIETRKASLKTDELKKEDHIAWLKDYLKNKKGQIYIAIKNSTPIGTIRSEYRAKAHELSWTIAPEVRGQGLGKIIVAQLAEMIKAPITATIKDGNNVSVSIAEYAGMRFVQMKNKILYYRRDALKKNNINT